LRHVILDTETTGLSVKDGHRIVEVGLVEMKNLNITSLNFHTYINPEREIDFEAQKVHGLTLDFLKDKPLFKEIADEILNFIDNDTLVIHNAAFDMGFINNELINCDREAIQSDKVIDTLLLAKKAFPGARVSLDALCDKFQIDNSHRNLHGALIDADLLASVFIELNGGKQPNFEFIKKDRILNINNENLDDLNEKYQNKKIMFNSRKSVITEEERKLHEELLKKLNNPIWNI
tara:strand:+ start:121 stop:822 length:702 start_codon:yes stop_codon:yes gene_type:complete